MTTLEVEIKYKGHDIEIYSTDGEFKLFIDGEFHEAFKTLISANTVAYLLVNAFESEE